MDSKTNSLVEVVARALCVADYRNPDEDSVAGQAGAFENYGPLWQANHRSENTLGGRNYVSDATAAINAVYEAIREPSDEMEVAARKFTRGYHDIPDKDWRHHMPADLFRLAFKAMLAASPIAPSNAEKSDG